MAEDNYHKAWLPTWSWIHAPFRAAKIMGTTEDITLRDQVDQMIRSGAAFVTRITMTCATNRHGLQAKTANRTPRLDRLEAWDVIIRVSATQGGTQIGHRQHPKCAHHRAGRGSHHQ